MFMSIINVFVACRIVSVQLMEHMFVPAYHLQIKFHLLDEKVYQHKMLWLLVVSTCNSYSCGQDGKAVHTIHVFFLRLLTVAISNFQNLRKVVILTKLKIW